MPNRIYTHIRVREATLSPSLKPNPCPMNEKLLERKLVAAVKQKGGIAIKLTSPSFTGLPDRMILMPKNNIYFAELKTTGKKPTERQVYVLNQLHNLGFFATVIDTQSKLDSFLEIISSYHSLTAQKPHDTQSSTTE